MISSMVIINALGLCELKITKFCGYRNNARLGLVLVCELLSHEELAGHLLLIFLCCVIVKFMVLNFGAVQSSSV